MVLCSLMCIGWCVFVGVYQMLALFRLISRLPLGAVQTLAGWLGWLGYLCSPSLRGRIRKNLDRAEAAGGVNQADARISSDRTPASERIVASERLARQSVVHSAKMIGESPWLWFRPLAQVAAKVHCVNEQVLDEAEALGKGVLFITPHIGNFDAAARWYAYRRGVTVLFKPPKQALLQLAMKAARSGERMQAAPTSVAGLRMCLRALRSGSGVAILPDQVPTEGDGRWVPFFGEPAYTMTLPQRLVEMSGAAVVLVLCERLGNGQGWRLHVERMLEPPTPEATNRTMERMIARLPAQYLWSYNRYKRPAHVSAP